MRWFALYLPQFHEIAENNKWWGKGFTEWTHVKGATPLYKNHKQPIIPQNHNYYNLLDKETVQWQTSLMKKHGISGFVYYHYYFQGKKLLEKPAENLLKWKDIDQPFFFCWANHSWYQAIKGEKKLLREQTYGTQQDWEDHFQYLLPFFRDERYEKNNNRPVFMIFFSAFSEKNDIVSYFDKRCKEEGFDGIHIIETFSHAFSPNSYSNFRKELSPYTRNVYVREPDAAKNAYLRGVKRRYSPTRIIRKIRRTLALNERLSWVDIYPGKDIYRQMLKPLYTQSDVCHGVFFSWDNTPRHGVRGYVITPPAKEQFMAYADLVKDDEYVFINAWNEWAEGMILEPTEHEGDKYLSWIAEWNNKNG